jgi:hypothetical protein
VTRTLAALLLAWPAYAGDTFQQGQLVTFSAQDIARNGCLNWAVDTLALVN